MVKPLCGFVFNVPKAVFCKFTFEEFLTVVTTITIAEPDIVKPKVGVRIIYFQYIKKTEHV